MHDTSNVDRDCLYIEGLMVSSGYGDYLKVTLPLNKSYFDNLVIITTVDDFETQSVCKQNDIRYLLSDEIHKDGAGINRGLTYNKAVKKLNRSGWILFFDADIILPVNFRTLLQQQQLDTEYLYYTGRVGPVDDIKNQIISFLENRELIHSWEMGSEFANQGPWGYFQLFNVNATTLRHDECWYPENFHGVGESDNQFQLKWGDKKRLLPQPQFRVAHLYHQLSYDGEGLNWNGRRTPKLCL